MPAQVELRPVMDADAVNAMMDVAFPQLNQGHTSYLALDVFPGGCTVRLNADYRHLRPGDTLSFSAVDAAAAARARQEQGRLFAAWRAALSALPPAGGLDATALYAANLVGGVLRGDED